MDLDPGIPMFKLKSNPDSNPTCLVNPDPDPTTQPGSATLILLTITNLCLSDLQYTSIIWKNRGIMAKDYHCFFCLFSTMLSVSVRIQNDAKSLNNYIQYTPIIQKNRGIMVRDYHCFFCLYSTAFPVSVGTHRNEFRIEKLY